MSNVCTQLDEFLDRELSASDAILFEAHLAVCEACRSTVEQQQWLDELMCSAATKESLSANLARIDLSPPQQSKGWWKAVSVAAAALIVATFAWQSFSSTEPVGRQDSHTIAAKEESATTTVTEETCTELTPVATIVPEDDVIVVPVDSGSPEVTILHVYPTASARNRWRRETMLKDSIATLNGG